MDSSIFEEFDHETIRKVIRTFRHHQLQIEPIPNDSDHWKLAGAISKLYNICLNNNAETATVIMQDMKIGSSIIEMFFEPLPVDSGESYEYKWRLDISMPQACAILLNIKQKDGESVSFRMDLPTFHKLRFNTSLLLREMQTLKSALN